MASRQFAFANPSHPGALCAAGSVRLINTCKSPA